MECLTCEDETHRLSRNVGNYQSNCETSLQNEDLITTQRKPEIVGIQAANHQQWNNKEI